MSRDLLAPRPLGASLPTSTPATPPRPAPAGGRVLVAVDGTRASDAALVVGDGLARRDGGEVIIYSVYEPLPTLGDPSALTTELTSMDAAVRARFADTVGEQLRRTGFDASPWEVVAERGQPARAIARAADARDVRLVVLGLGRHGPVERALGRETAIQVARTAGVPVLAVPPTMRALPRRALVAVDFGPSSRAAARAALALLGERGALYLVHAAPSMAVPGAELGAWDPAWEREYDRAAERMLEEVERELGAPEGVHVTRLYRRGAPAPELLDLAAREAIDLIATGSHGHGPIARAFLGSVSTRVMRGAACAVLVVPPAAAASLS